MRFATVWCHPKPNPHHDFPCFLFFSFYLHICLCFVRFFKVFGKCAIHSFIFFHMVCRVLSFINPAYGLGCPKNVFHRRIWNCEVRYSSHRNAYTLCPWSISIHHLFLEFNNRTILFSMCTFIQGWWMKRCCFVCGL